MEKITKKEYIELMLKEKNVFINSITPYHFIEECEGIDGNDFDNLKTKTKLFEGIDGLKTVLKKKCLKDFVIKKYMEYPTYLKAEDGSSHGFKGINEYYKKNIENGILVLHLQNNYFAMINFIIE